MKFTKVPTDTFSKIQLNAGVLLTNFTPSTATIDANNIIAATSGGNSFSCVPTYKDFGADIDNVPDNTKELKKIDYWDVTLSGTMVTIDTAAAKLMLGAADIASEKVTPRADLKVSDFADIWWAGDYSDENGEDKGGFIAIRVIDALSTGGFKLTTSDKEKGKFAYEFKGHYSIANIAQVPCEIYIKAGEA